MEQENPRQAEQPKEEENFIDVNEVAEVVNDDDGGEFNDDAEAEAEMEMEIDTEETGDPAGSSADQEVIEIDMSNNSSIYFDKHTDSIFTVFSHPTLPLVVSGGGDDTAYLWTTNSHPPKLLAQLTGHTESVITGAFTYDGAFLITGDMSGQVRIWKSVRKGQMWQFHDSLAEVEEIVWLRTHPRQQVFAFGAADGSVWVFSLEPHLEQIMCGTAHSLECNAGVFTRLDDLDSLTLVTCSEDSSVVSWNCYTGATNYVLTNTHFKTETPWVSMAVNAAGTTLAVGSRDGQLAVVKVDTGTVAVQLRTASDGQDESDASIEAVAWCEAVPILALGNVAGEIKLYDTGTWRLRRTIPGEDAVTKLEFLPQSPVLVSSTMGGLLAKWDVRTGEQKWKGQGHSGGVLDFAIQKNGQRLITAGDEGVSLVFNDESESA